MPDQNQPTIPPVPPVLTVEETPPMPNPPSPSGGGPPSGDIAGAAPTDIGGAPLDIPPVITPAPTRRRFGGRTVATILGLLILLGGLGAGLILVRQRQEVREKAAGACNMRWPADPNTACGKSTQSPAQGATGVSLTPAFHWDYGGYRPEDNGQCVQPSGCTTYGAAVYLAEGKYSDSSIIAACNLGGASSSTPLKDAPFSCFRVWRDGPPLGPLKPNTLYSWTVTPYGDGVVHAEQTWNYNFTTGGGVTTTGQCQNIQAFDTNWTKITNLSTLKTGDKVRFTVAGTTTSGSFDKARFTINGTLRPEVTGKRPTTEEFYDEYTVPTGVTNFTVKAEVHHTTLGWL